MTLEAVLMQKELSPLKVNAHHAGGGSSCTSTDHHVRDVAAPVSLALFVGEQGEGSLLQLGGGAGSCAENNIQVFRCVWTKNLNNKYCTI